MKTTATLLSVIVVSGCLSAPPVPSDGTETIEEPDLTLSRFETFETEPLSVQISHFSDSGGEGILSVSGSTSLATDRESGCLGFETDTSFGFSTPCEAGPGDWFNYYLTIDTQRSPAGFDGVALELKSRNCSYLELTIKDERRSGLFLARVPVFLNDGEWRRLRVPFSCFVPDEEGESIDLRSPLILEIAIPYDQNLYLGHFLPGGGNPALLVDNLAFFKRKAPAAAGADAADLTTGTGASLEDFEDSISDILFYGELAETVFYVDYTQSDSGECRMTPGVRSQVFTMETVQERDKGFFRVRSEVSLTPDFEAYLDEGRSFYLFLRAPVHNSLKERQGFRFSVRSDLIREGQVDFIDTYNGAYYSAGFHPSAAWTEVRLPFNRILGDEGSLADVDPDRSAFTLIFSGEIPPERLRQSFETGVFTFAFDLDEIGFF